MNTSQSSTASFAGTTSDPDHVVIVGGGNSARQAAVFLAETAKHVHLLVRKDDLAETMSRYLVRRIEEHPAITVRTRTEFVALDGDRHLQHVQWRDSRTGVVKTHDISHAFMTTGALPNTGWLDGCVALDARAHQDGPGFVIGRPDDSRMGAGAATVPVGDEPSGVCSRLVTSVADTSHA